MLVYLPEILDGLFYILGEESPEVRHMLVYTWYCCVNVALVNIVEIDREVMHLVIFPNFHIKNSQACCYQKLCMYMYEHSIRLEIVMAVE